MERLHHLIGKLKEQFEQKSPPSQMLVTLKQIEAELVSPAYTSNGPVQNAKITVVMPSSIKATAIEPDLVQALEVKEKRMEEELATFMPKLQNQEAKEWILDPLNEIPTLSHQQAAREINDVIGSNGASLNDKLKGNIVDLAAALKEAPVRELKKAIGVNDRYVFINELFRGDEPMYERSIKTINNFRILPEAEYWMERELKIKLGWDDSREITKHFYQLVRRRFA
ncbi:MAG: hypothetical protein ACHQEM_11410 [Chitinophagales bacterium]